MEKFTVSTKALSQNARGKSRKLTRTQRLALTLAQDDEMDASTKPAKKNKNALTGTEEEDGDYSTGSMSENYETKNFFLGQKIGSKGIRKSLQSNHGKSNITPSLANLESFRRAMCFIDPLMDQKRQLIEGYCANIDSWLFHLLQGSNLLLYGIGSKTEIIDELSSSLQGQDTLLLDGSSILSEYRGSEKLVKSMLDYICKDILKKPDIMSRSVCLVTATMAITDELNKYYDREINTSDPFYGFMQRQYSTAVSLVPITSKTKQIVASKYPQTISKNRPLLPSTSEIHSLPSDSDSEDDYVNMSFRPLPDTEDMIIPDPLPLQRRTIPVQSNTRQNLDKSKFAKSSWKGRYRYAHPKLYVIVRDIDGPALSSSITQTCLSLLAACDAVGLVATCQHINTPILWSDDKLKRFNWRFEQVSTFISEALSKDFVLLPTEQTLLEGVAKERSLDSLLTSVTDKHREILKLIAKETVMTLQSSDDAKTSSVAKGDFKGIEEERILRACKSLLILRTPIELKNMLKELIDQKTIKASNGYIEMSESMAREILNKLKTS